MASRLGVSRVTQRIQLRLVHTQDLVSTRVVRLRKFSTTYDLADLHTKFLPVGRLSYDCELHRLQSVTVYYNSHASMHRDYMLSSRITITRTRTITISRCTTVIVLGYVALRVERRYAETTCSHGHT